MIKSKVVGTYKFKIGFNITRGTCASTDELTGCTGPRDDKPKAEIELEPFGTLVDTGICMTERNWLTNRYGILEGLVDSC